jgi:hypothetical protein
MSLACISLHGHMINRMGCATLFPISGSRSDIEWYDFMKFADKCLSSLDQHRVACSEASRSVMLHVCVNFGDASFGDHLGIPSPFKFFCSAMQRDSVLSGSLR